MMQETPPKTKIELINRRILVGRNTNDHTIYVLELDTLHEGYSKGYFSITYEGFDDNFMTEEQGEERAREYLEDGELWRDAVDNEHTTDSLEDWIDEVISVDGWEHVVGDIHYIDADVGDYYTQLCSCGAGSGKTYRQIDELKIKRKDLVKIAKAVDTLHLKQFDGTGQKDGPFKEMTEQERKFASEVIEIFKSYPEFDESEDLKQYIKVEEKELEA